MKEVEDSFNRLTRLIVAIRKSGTQSRLRKADSLFDAKHPQIRSLRLHLETLLLVKPDKDGNSASSAEKLDSARLTPIQSRLIDANLKRRNRFLYAQKHAEKLGTNSFSAVNMQGKRPVSAKQPQDSAVSDTKYISQGTKILIKDDPPVQSTTTATLVGDTLEVSPKQVIKSATTVVSVTSARISYPKPPPIHDDQLLFTCPCCCQSLHSELTRGNHWK